MYFSSNWTTVAGYLRLSTCFSQMSQEEGGSDRSAAFRCTGPRGGQERHGEGDPFAQSTGSVVTQQSILLLKSVRPATKIPEGRARFHPPVTLEDLRNATKRGIGGGGYQDSSISCVPIGIRDSERANGNSKDHPSHAAPSGNLDIGRRRRRWRHTFAIAAKAATFTDAD